MLCQLSAAQGVLLQRVVTANAARVGDLPRQPRPATDMLLRHKRVTMQAIDPWVDPHY